MNAYFYYGDDFRSSKDFNCVLATRPKMKKPQRRNTNIVVAGRDGDLLSADNSYDNTNIELELNIKSKTLNDVQDDINDLYNWLDKGSYTPLSFFFDKQCYYKVAFQGDFEYENTKKTGLITRVKVKFTAKPFKFLKNSSVITQSNKSFFIENKNNRESLPTISIYGSGNLTLTVNGEKYSITNLIDNIVINSELYSCYRKIGQVAEQAEQNILNYTFPVLKPGKNSFVITVDSGTFNRIEIQPNWRI